MTKAIFIFLVYLSFSVCFSQLERDTLIAGVRNYVSVSMPADRIYAKYTIRSEEKGALSNIIEIPDSGRYVANAYVYPSCHCQNFIVNMIGVTKKGTEEKIGSVEFPVKKAVLKPRWRIKCASNGVNDTIPVEARSNTAKIVENTSNCEITLEIPNPLASNDTNYVYRIRKAELYLKDGLADFVYFGKIPFEVDPARTNNDIISYTFVANPKNLRIGLIKMATLLIKIQAPAPITCSENTKNKKPMSGKSKKNNTQTYSFSLLFNNSMISKPK